MQLSLAIPLLLAALAGSCSAPDASVHAAGTTPAPRLSVEHAGFLSDARVHVSQSNELVFEAKVAWPATISRRSFVVEGRAADGSLLFAKEATASASSVSGRHKHAATAKFELELPALAGVSEVRVRLAR